MLCGERWAQTSDTEITGPLLNRLRHTYRHEYMYNYASLNYNDTELVN